MELPEIWSRFASSVRIKGSRVRPHNLLSSSSRSGMHFKMAVGIPPKGSAKGSLWVFVYKQSEAQHYNAVSCTQELLTVYCPAHLFFFAHFILFYFIFYSFFLFSTSFIFLHLCIFFVFVFHIIALSMERTWLNISLLVIHCIIVYVTNKILNWIESWIISEKADVKAAVRNFCLFVALCLKTWNCSFLRNYLACAGLWSGVPAWLQRGWI